MQSGGSRIAIVQDMHGLSFYRNKHVTAAKKDAHRKHRSRVNQNMKLMAREAMDADDFDPQPRNTEALDSWDLW